MPFANFFHFIFLLIYHFGFSLTYGYFALTSWGSLSICYERLSILIFLILLIGVHATLTPTRFFFRNNQLFDFEFTLIGILVFISNEIEADSCMDDQDDSFLEFSEYTFYSFLLINTCCCLLYIIWIFIYIMIRVFRYGESFSQQNFLAFNNQDLNINNSEGLTFHELNRLKQWKFNRNEADIRNKTCSICLNDFMDEEALTRLPECDHLFHNECVIDWLKGHLICPYCRCDIRAALEKENPLINRVMISENLDQ